MKDRRIISTDILYSYRQYLTEGEKSPATISKYMHDMRCFAEFAAGRPVSKILTMQYKEHLQTQYAATSSNSMLAALNSFLKFAGWHDCCVKQLKVQKQIYCTEEKELTRREYQRLIKAAKRSRNRKLALIIETLCATGIRVSELPYLTVDSLYHGEMTVSCKGKRRTVFLVRDLCRKLLQFVKMQGITEGPVFITRSGTPVDRYSIWRQMKKLCSMAGVAEGKVFPHNLRHLFARCFYEVEKDIVKLADILGHSSINTTRIYMISTGTEHRRRLERMQLVL